MRKTLGTQMALRLTLDGELPHYSFVALTSSQKRDEATTKHNMANLGASAPDKDVKDVIIIGAGPCGLAVAARLREHTPSALFTDEEHQRYHWIRKHSGHKMNVKPLHGKNQSNPDPPEQSKRQRHDSAIELEDDGLQKKASMLVLDATKDKWMAKWEHLFGVLAITHLRSPMFFHLDPRDRDGLLAYVYAHKRQDELQEICGCVGKEISKHKRKQRTSKAQRGYDRPSTRRPFVEISTLFQACSPR